MYAHNLTCVYLTPLDFPNVGDRRVLQLRQPLSTHRSILKIYNTFKTEFTRGAPRLLFTMRL